MNRIGIDPAFRKDGFVMCVIDENNEVQFTTFPTFLHFVRWLMSPDEAPAEAIVVIENSNLDNATYDMTGNKATIARKSRNVGCNQAISQCTYEICKWKYGNKAFGVTPGQKGKKWTDMEFKAVVRQEKHILINYKGNKDEQDKRDAYKLALMATSLMVRQRA